MAKNEIEILNECFLSAQNAELTADHLIDELMPYALLYSGTIDAERYGRRYITTGKSITNNGLITPRGKTSFWSISSIQQLQSFFPAPIQILQSKIFCCRHNKAIKFRCVLFRSSA